MEVGVLGLTSDQLTWVQWLQEDASRAELPLTSSKEETFPLGIALDTSTQKQLAWGENQFLPPMPVLILLSHRGVLCLFYVINTLPSAPLVCMPPEKLPDETTLGLFTAISVRNEPPSVPSSPQQVVSNTPQSIAPGGWSTPSGVMDINRIGLRVNLTEKFENIAPSQAQNVAKLGFPLPSNESIKPSEDSLASTDLTNDAFKFPKPASLGTWPSLGTQPQFGLVQPSNENSALDKTLTTSGQSIATLNFSVPVAASTPNLFIKPLQSQQPVQKQEPTSFNLQQSQQQTVNQSFFQSQLQLQQRLQPQTQQQQLQTQQQQQSQQQPQFAQLLQQQQPQQQYQQQPLQPQPSLQLQQTSLHLQQQIQQHRLVQRVTQLPAESLSSTNKLSNLFGNLGDAKVAATSENTLIKMTENKLTSDTSGDNFQDEVTKQTNENINSKVLYLAVQEEMNHFENKMVELKARLAKLNLEVGTSDEKTHLRMKVDAMDNFCQELQETTNAQCSEVQALKAEMVESLAWGEDARSRVVQENDPCWLQVVRSQELDPVSARYLANVKQLSYYVETQLCQADRSLELQWANFQESCRDKIKGRLYIPSLEAVYQAMVLQSNILLKQKENVKSIMERTAKHKMAKGGSASMLRNSIVSVQSKSDTDLAALAENLLQMRLEAGSSGAGGEDISDIMAAGRYSMVASMNRKLTSEKQCVLREFLTQGPVRHIRPVKTSGTAVRNLSVLEKHFKSQEVKALKPSSTETSPLGFLDKMVGRMESENLNGLKGSHFTSTPQGKSSPSMGVSEKEIPKSIDSVSTSGGHPGDLFGHIAKSVVTKFKEPDSTPSVTSLSEETSNNQSSQPDSSAVALDCSTNMQNLSFSFTPSVPLSSAIPLAKSKGTAAFSFGSLSQSTTQFGEGMAKGITATSFNFQVPTTPAAATTASSTATTLPASTMFMGAINKPSSFSFFPSSSVPATTPVQFFGSIASETSSSTGSISTGSTKQFSFSSLPGSTTTAPTTISAVPSTFGDKVCDKVNFGQTSVSQETKTTLAPSSFGSLSVSNSNAEFSFAVPSSLPGQSTSGTVKPIFGGPQTKLMGETSIPDSSSQSLANKSAAPTLSLFGTGSSVTTTGVTSTTTTANAQVLPSVSVYSSGNKSSQSTNDFSLGQLNATLSLTPGLDTSKEIRTPEKSNQSPVSTSHPDISVSISAVTTSSVSIKPFTFSLPSVSTSPATTTGTKTSDESEKNNISTTSAAVSFFGQSVCSPSISQNATSIFGQKTPASIFGGSSNTIVPTVSDTEEKTTSSIVPTVLATPIVTTVATPEATVNVTSSATNSSLFSGSALAYSLPSLGTVVSTNSAAAATTATTTITTTTTTTMSTTPSLFGNVGTNATLLGGASTTPSSVFGGPTTSASVFGSGTSFFGQASTTSNSSMFKPQGIASSLFGQATVTATPTTTVAGSIFGQATTSTTSVFGQTPVTSSSSIFGQPSTSTTSSVFGQPPATTTSIFGQPATTTTSSIFGQPTTSTASVFGHPAVTTGTSLFGQPATTSVTSVFGQPAAAAAATTSTSVFGSSTPAASIFGQPASTTSTNVFGQPASPPSAFGGTTNAFGQSSGSFMGGGTQPTFGSSPTFGQSGGSIFGQSSGSGFGASGGSIFGGGSATFGKPGNLFQSPSGGSIFGGSSTAGGSTGGAFSAPQGQSIAESGFGSPTAFGQQSKPGGFGSPPAFGQSSGGSGFGGSPTFGGAPTFGGSPVFGSPNRGFGATTSPPSGNLFGGGNAPQQSNTFENLASQNTMTFGNLASGQSPSFGSSGGSMFGGAGTSQPQTSAFQNTPTFGGSSFSSWR